MKLKKLVIPLSAFAMTLSIPGAHAQADSYLASPFNSVRKTPQAESVSKLSAKSALSQSAARKGPAATIDGLLDKESSEYLVVFKDESPARAAIVDGPDRLKMQKHAFHSTRQAVRATFKSGDIEFVQEYANLPTALVRTSSRAAFVKLLNNPKVVSVTENVAFRPHMAESLPLIRQPDAALAGRGGAGTSVIVFDDGVDYANPALGSCTSAGVPASCRLLMELDYSGTGFTRNPLGHGTQMAAIISQVAPGTKIIAIDVAPDPNRLIMSNVIRGIDWAITQRDTYNIVAFNLSAGIRERFGKCESDVDDAMRNAFKRAKAHNIIAVVSSGNDAGYQQTAQSYPACAGSNDQALVVGAVYDAVPANGLGFSGHGCTDLQAVVKANIMTCFSNGGELVKLLAPGARIVAGGINDSGTSQAAPHVAGAIAILRGANAAPNDTWDQTVARLTNGSPRAVDRTVPSRTIPVLDLASALKGLIPEPRYVTVSQQIYVGFFGRPADPAGLLWFAKTLSDIGAPTDISTMEQAYGSNSQVRSLIDSFGNSPESMALYAGDNGAYVTGLYRNLFNRDPDSGGLAYWKGLLDAGSVSRGRVTLAIMSSSMSNADGATIVKKGTVAANFTKSLDLKAEIESYTNAKATAQARTMLRNVYSWTDPQGFQPTIDATILSIVQNR